MQDPSEQLVELLKLDLEFGHRGDVEFLDGDVFEHPVVGRQQVALPELGERLEHLAFEVVGGVLEDAQVFKVGAPLREFFA